ncbi:MAG TPA: glycosyltransferase [Chthoniobacterales bacterium]|nr:glycosyltransferase [Chthoniobacterales bacterium]
MRILRSIHSVNPALGGPIESVKQSSAVLVRRGHVVEIVSLDAPKDSWVRDCPVKVHALGPGRGNYGYTPAFSRWIKERHANYDAVIVQGLWQYSSFGVWRALRGTATPCFVFPHGMLDPWFKRNYPLKHLKKLLYWPWAEYRVLKDAAAVLFTSEEERRLARESFAPYQCNELVVNYGTAGPEIELADAREDFFHSFPQLRGRRFLLFLGRLHEKKGCELLIEAFAALRNSASADQSLDLVLAGPCADTGYQAQLKHMASAVSGVTFTGMLAGAQKWGAFSAAEAFILPSHQENFGIAVVEALACGTPVLISNKVNIWREIAAAGAGYAENDDLAGTARLIERWVGTPADVRATMKGNARECFARHFEINRATDSLLAVLEGRQSARTEIAAPNP